MRQLLLSALAGFVMIAPVSAAQEAPDSDEIVRLPGSGTVKNPDFYPGRKGAPPKKLVPGGGLIVSFDANQDGIVTAEEVAIGADSAFRNADANQDGDLTALEQKAWAHQLPTRDDTLANPMRFNPNLDHRVSLIEFVSVVQNLARDYAEDTNGVITLAALEVRGERGGRRPRARGSMPPSR